VGRVLAVAFFVAGCSDEPPSDDGTGGNGTGGTGGVSASGGSSSGSGGTPQGGSGGATGGTSNSSLFTMAPDCDGDVEKLQGNFMGAAVGDNRPLEPSTLTNTAYYTNGTPGRIRLQWGALLEPNVALPFTQGGYLRTFWDSANPDVLYCIVAGEIGGMATEAADDYFKYSITRVRSGEVGMTGFAMPAQCDGAESDVSLFGCVYRDN
jgi:hypothetical protein